LRQPEFNNNLTFGRFAAVSKREIHSTAWADWGSRKRMAKSNETGRMPWPRWAWVALLAVIVTSILTIVVTLYTAH